MIDNMANIYLPQVSDEGLDESVGARSIFYRLGESEIFSYANNHVMLGGLRLVDVIPRMVVPDMGFVQVELSMFDKTLSYELFDSNRFRLNCKKNMRELLDKGSVQMVYSETYRLPMSIPYIVQSSANGNRIFVNITDFVTMDQFGVFNVDSARNYNALMAVLFAACMAYRIVSMNGAITGSAIDGMCSMYASMLSRIITGMVHVDPITAEKIRYLCWEFASVQMFGTEKGTKRFYDTKKRNFPKLTNIIQETLDNQFNVDAFDALTPFVEELKKHIAPLKGLTTYMIYDKWIRTYGSATAMSLDYFGFHLYTICMVLLESPLITRSALEPVLEKSRGTDLYKYFQQII